MRRGLGKRTGLIGVLHVAGYCPSFRPKHQKKSTALIPGPTPHRAVCFLICQSLLRGEATFCISDLAPTGQSKTTTANA
jgi:hypothetical protein